MGEFFMKIELNRKVIEQLKAIYFLMQNKHAVPHTYYFPFIVCLEWVTVDGVSVGKRIQDKRIKLCEAYNVYLQDGEQGSFEQVKACLRSLLAHVEDMELKVDAAEVSQMTKFLMKQMKEQKDGSSN